MIELAAALVLTCAGIDGDTLVCGSERVRLPHIDAPELHSPKCEAERYLALQATAFTRAWLEIGPVELVPYSRAKDRYGRTLAYVRRNGEDLGEELVARGLARVWTGRRESWCD